LLAECDRYVIALFADLVISLLGICEAVTGGRPSMY
jgi:hypothetical protein